VAWLDYGLVLPALARLPRALAWPLLVVRGAVNFAFDWDWRTLALGHGYVRSATLEAMRQLVTLSGSRQSPLWLTLKRYVRFARGGGLLAPAPPGLRPRGTFHRGAGRFIAGARVVRAWYC
jgi:hypothetical protein